MFCPSCGAKNAADARFCNRCGAALAAPSANTTIRGPGTRGPAAGSTSGAADGGAQGAQGPAAGPFGYAPGADDPGASSVSLASIGVQSSRRTWAVIGGAAALLLALGALGGWLASRGGAPAPEVPPDVIAAPMEIGTPTAVDDVAPVPEGVAPPGPARVERTGAVRAGERARPGTLAGGGAGGGRASGGAAAGSGAAGGAGGSGGAARRWRQRRARPRRWRQSAARPARRCGAAGGSGAAGAGAPDTAGGGAAETAGAEAAGGDATAADPGAAAEEERDLLLDLYATRVRRYIRTYYATRAQSCFDHASRNNEGIRGTVVVAFTISATGPIEDARATRNTTGDDALGACLVNQVRVWELPAPPGGALELAMPFSR